MTKSSQKKLLLTLMCITASMIGCSEFESDQGIVKTNNVDLNYASSNQSIIEKINADLSNIPPAAGGKKYYVCDTGDDENSGTSKFAPLKSFDYAISKFGGLDAGDEIVFCRGGVFLVSNYKALFNTHATSLNPIKIRDYYPEGATGDELRPVLENPNAGVFYFNTRKKSNELPDGGVVIENLVLKGGENNTSTGVFLLNGFSNVAINNVSIVSFRVGVSVGGGANESQYISLTNSVVFNNKDQGWLGGGSHIKILNNLFQNNGFGGPKTSYFYHNVYVSNPAEVPANDVLVSGNTLYQSAMVGGKCGGASLVVHGKVNDLVIENNVVKEDKGLVTQFCYGIGVGPAYNKPEAFKNVTIRNNQLINMGRVGISGGSLIGAVIENNIIVDESSILNEGIVVPDGRDGGDGHADDAKSKNVKISGNLIYANQASARGISVGGTAQYTVQNNKISLLATAKDECIKKTNANKDIDTSTNKCINHNSPYVVTSLIEAGLASEVFNSINVGTPDNAGGSSLVKSAPVKLAPVKLILVKSALAESIPLESSSNESSSDRSSSDRSSSDRSSSDRSSSDRSSSDRSSSDRSSSDRSSSDRSSSDRSSSDRSSSNGSSSNGSSSNGSSSNGSSSNGSSSVRSSSVRSSSDRSSSVRSSSLVTTGVDSSNRIKVEPKKSDLKSVTVKDYNKSRGLLKKGEYQGKCRATSSDGRCLMI